MAGLAKITVVLARHIGRDQFTFSRREGAGSMKKSVRQFAHRLCRFGSKREAAGDARQTFRKRYMWHSFLSSELVWCCLQPAISAGRYSLLMLTYPSRAIRLPRSR